MRIHEHPETRVPWEKQMGSTSHNAQMRNVRQVAKEDEEAEVAWDTANQQCISFLALFLCYSSVCLPLLSLYFNNGEKGKGLA